MMSQDSDQSKRLISTELENGISLLDQGEIEQAKTIFLKALKKSPEETLVAMQKRLKTAVSNDNHNVTLNLGRIIFQANQNDFELLNILGNAARRLKDFNQSEQLYRQALKINDSYLLAAHNLSACMARRDLYDQEVSAALAPYSQYKEHVLPPYTNDFKVDPGKNTSEIFSDLKQAIKDNWKNHSITEGRKILQNDIYNLGLFALSQKNYSLASENFKKLRQQQCTIFYLEMVFQIADKESNEEPKLCVSALLKLLRIRPHDRYLHINIALMYQELKNQLMANKHFLICDALLKKSEGFFDMESLIQAADQKANERDFKTALLYYQKATNEVQYLSLWEKTANLLFHLNDFSGATKAFNKVLGFAPESHNAREKLNQIYRNYLDKARFLKKAGKLKRSAAVFEKALLIKKPPQILEETAEIYELLNKPNRANELLAESQTIREKNQSEQDEKKRQFLIQKGVKALKEKEFTIAIENLEQAAEIELDKDTFMYLSHIYKDLKRTKALQNLLNRWHQIQNSISAPNSSDE